MIRRDLIEHLGEAVHHLRLAKELMSRSPKQEIFSGVLPKLHFDWITVDDVDRDPN